MEVEAGGPAAQQNTIKYFYTKRHQEPATMPETGQTRMASSGQTLPLASSSHASPCNFSLEVGAFYEIDHEKLPPKSPIQLKAVRAVKVSEARELDVTVSFPSILSLRNYFALSPDPGREPELDERFVMSSNQAARILRRLIPPEEVDGQKQLERFWLVTSSLQDFSPLVMPSFSVAKRASEDVKRSIPSTGSCLLAMKHAGLVGWGIRRKVKYIGRYRTALSEEKEGESQVDGEPHPLHHQQMMQRHQLQQNKHQHEENQHHSQFHQSQNQLNEQQQLPHQSGSKRKRELPKKERKGKINEKKKKPDRGVNDEKNHNNNNTKKMHKEKGSKDRWSSDRYESAELKLLDIMREKDARLGRPIMRQELREEARKHIGDTGLLDHLLKHMSGKVVMDGALRFRRRHNSEGQMEYWLEPADLMEVRKKAGVLDPCWVPPPGWKPGDSTFSVSPCGDDCKIEMCQLKEEIATLRRDIEVLSSLKDEHGVVKASNSEVCIDSLIWQENYQKMLEKNNNLEEKVACLSTCLLGLKEELRLLKEENEYRKEKEKEKQVLKEDKSIQHDGGDDKGQGKLDEDNRSITIAKSNISNPVSVANADAPAINNKKSNSPGSSSKKAVRRSGFRICKPQGTFLWPDMACTSRAAAAAATIDSPRMSSAATAGGFGVELVSLSPTSSRRPQGGGGGRGDHLNFPGAAAGAATTMAAATTDKNADATVEEHLMLVGGVPTPSSTASTATSAQRLFLVPSPLSPVLTPAAQAPEVAMVPSPNYAQRQPQLLQQQQQQHMLQEMTSCSYDQNNMICCTSHVYQSHSHIVTRIRSSSSCECDGGEGKIKGSDESSTVPSWQVEKKKWKGNVTTDLALATPSSSSYN